VIFSAVCVHFFRCKHGYISLFEKNSSAWEQDVMIFVDNKKVTKLVSLGRCHFLYASEHEATWISEGDKPGQYGIAIKTNQVHKFMKIQSFVVIPYYAEKF